MKAVTEEKDLSTESRFKEIENYINLLEKSEPSAQQLLILKEAIIQFAAQMCAMHIEDTDNPSAMLSKLKTQTTPHSLATHILTFIKD